MLWYKSIIEVLDENRIKHLFYIVWTDPVLQGVCHQETNIIIIPNTSKLITKNHLLNHHIFMTTNNQNTKDESNDFLENILVQMPNIDHKHILKCHLDDITKFENIRNINHSWDNRWTIWVSEQTLKSSAISSGIIVRDEMSL